MGKATDERVEGPVYNQLLGLASDASDKTVTFCIGNSPTEGFSANIALGLVGPLVAALTAEARKLNTDLRDVAGVNAATLNCRAVWLSQDAEGSPVFVFELANGSPLPLAIKGGDLSELAAELTLLSAPPPDRAN